MSESKKCIFHEVNYVLLEPFLQMHLIMCISLIETRVSISEWLRISRAIHQLEGTSHPV